MHFRWWREGKSGMRGMRSYALKVNHIGLVVSEILRYTQKDKHTSIAFTFKWGFLLYQFLSGNKHHKANQRVAYCNLNKALLIFTTVHNHKGIHVKILAPTFRNPLLTATHKTLPLLPPYFLNKLKIKGRWHFLSVALSQQKALILQGLYFRY